MLLRSPFLVVLLEFPQIKKTKANKDNAYPDHHNDGDHDGVQKKPDHYPTSFSRSITPSPRMVRSLRKSSSTGWVVPVSQRWIVAKETPAATASCSRVKPARRLSSINEIKITPFKLRFCNYDINQYRFTFL